MTAEQTFGELVKQARSNMDLTQEQAAARSGGRISASNWRVVEAGGRDAYRDRTLRGIEIALGWRPGTAALAMKDPYVALGQIADRDAVDAILEEEGKPARERPDYNRRVQRAPDYVRKAIDILLDGSFHSELQRTLALQHWEKSSPLRLAADAGNPDVEREPGHPSSDVEPEPEGP